MILTQQKAELILPPGVTGLDLMKQIEAAGRTCYQSQGKTTEESYQRFLANLLSRGHETPLEFADLTYRITASRAVMAELTRHRMASFQVESQRYVNYGKQEDITFIKPSWYGLNGPGYKPDLVLDDALNNAEVTYQYLIRLGMKPEQAREVLPNCTACNIIMKANLREWRHIFALRCAPNAYPATRELALDMLRQAHEAAPQVFEDLYDRYFETRVSE